MALWETQFDEVDATRLQALADEGVLEGLRLEYKSEFDLTSSKGKRAFLKAITAFANTAGGDLVIGMQTSAGRPIDPMSASTAPDADKLRLENVIRDSVEPRLHGLRLKEIALPAGGYALLVRVPQSLNSPHRVTFEGMNRFYGRTSAGTYELDLEELRRIFTIAPRLAERVRDFRAARLMKIAAGETPVELSPGFRIVLHLVPLTLFSEGRNRSFVSAAAQHWLEFNPLGHAEGTSHGFNLDGMFTYHEWDSRRGRVCLGYTHVFSAGAIEYVLVEETRERSPSEHLLSVVELAVADGVIHFGRALRACDVSGPIALLVSLIGVGGLSSANARRKFDRDMVPCEEIVLEYLPDSRDACALALRTLFDQISRAAGFERSLFFNQNGTWQLRDRH